MSKVPEVSAPSMKAILKADEQFNEVQKDFKETVTTALERRISLPPVQPESDARRSIPRAALNDNVPVLRPLKSIADKNPFNEKYRKDWERGWEYVKAIVENHEIIGESVECWTKKFAGDPAHFWRVPVNKAVMIPRLLAEQLAACQYHRIVLEERPQDAGNGLTFYGAAQAVEVKNRISARIIPEDSISIAMGF